MFSPQSWRTPASHHLLITTHDFLSRLDLKQEVDVLVLDFSKAFGTVPYERLLQELQHYGIQEDVLLWIISFLTTRTQSVLVDGICSWEDQVLSGHTFLVPYKSVVDPRTAVHLFADDCLLYHSINHLRDQV